METADRDSPCPTEGRVLRMLGKIEEAASAYESTQDGGPPVTDDEVQRYREEHGR